MPRTNRHRNRNSEAGMTLIELLIASAVLVFGMLSLMGLLMLAIGNNGRSKIDSTATMLTQSVVEQITAVLEGGGPGTIQDCVNPPWTVDNSAGPSPNGQGAALAGGNIDFTQKNPPKNYFMNYVECSLQPNGTVTQMTYDVRWNVQLVEHTYLVTVGAKPKGGLPTRFAFALPVTMRVYVGEK
jgi:type II secretory pathway pseudopilin PulG